MRPKARFIKSIIDASLTCQTELPWARGKRRHSFANPSKAKPCFGALTA